MISKKRTRSYTLAILLVVCLVSVQFFSSDSELYLAGDLDSVPMMIAPNDTHCHRDQPAGVTEKRYQQEELEGKRILHYIVTTLHEVGVPVVLLYGTALYEYRNGTTLCIQPSWTDDDFDIGVFREHFHYVVLMLNDIQRIFGWRTVYGLKVVNNEHNKDSFITLLPPNTRVKKGFQIDIYGMHVNHPAPGLVDFTWDKQVHDASFFFPLRKHKPIFFPPGYSGPADADDLPVVYVPFDMPCYLENLYGPGYMTPTKEKSGDVNPNLTKVGRPYCDKVLSPADVVEKERQMALLNRTYPFYGAADYIYYKNTVYEG